MILVLNYHEISFSCYLNTIQNAINVTQKRFGVGVCKPEQFLPFIKGAEVIGLAAKK